ncbi:MAG: hypothetical protein GX319_05000 [Clostridiales bacterium]|nr:hypothetical protein [Clostridiales bacterium]
MEVEDYHTFFVREYGALVLLIIMRL